MAGPRRKPAAAAGSNGNGNGSTIPPMDDGLIRDANGVCIIDDLTAACVVVAFIVQKMGSLSLSQICAKLREKQAVIVDEMVTQAVTALQKRGYLSKGSGRLGNETVDMYSVTKAGFGNTPDIIQITKHFVSNLVATDDARALVESLNVQEHEGSGIAKAKEKLKYADYVMVIARFSMIDRLLGGQPSSVVMDDLIKRGPECPKECKMRFPRDQRGRPIIPVDNIRGWLEKVVRTQHHQAAVSYVRFQQALIEFEGKIEQDTLPVVDPRGGGGLGLNTYETISPPAFVTMRMSIPTRGFMMPDLFEAVLATGAPMPERGLSNARSSNFGKAELIDFKELGMSKDPRVGLAALQDNPFMSPAGLAYAEKLSRKWAGEPQ